MQALLLNTLVLGDDDTAAAAMTCLNDEEEPMVFLFSTVLCINITLHVVNTN